MWQAGSLCEGEQRRVERRSWNLSGEPDTVLRLLLLPVWGMCLMCWRLRRALIVVLYLFDGVRAVIGEERVAVGARGGGGEGLPLLGVGAPLGAMIALDWANELR